MLPALKNEQEILYRKKDKTIPQLELELKNLLNTFHLDALKKEKQLLIEQMQTDPENETLWQQIQKWHRRNRRNRK